MLQVKNVTKKFGDFTAIKGLSFDVKEGSIYGLVGYNGAGKTTLLKTISGVYKADEGEIFFDGENIFDNEEKKQQMFYVPDDLYFISNASMDKMAKFYSGYYPNFSFETYEKMAEVFGLNKTDRINGFSKGMQRQAELVLGMATNPKLILLDESFDGLDPQKRALVKNMVTEYIKETGACAIISSHNLHELEDLCDNVGLINGKQLVMNCSIDELSQNSCRFRIYLGREVTKEEIEAVGIEIKDFKKDNTLFVFTVSGDIEEAEKKIKTLNPVFLEKTPLSLEEVFLERMEGTDYDFAEIFK
ncbi:MAG: ABC transporter ATP-binding protein [Clostridiales bacterium]|nr:ABC transporter ATP-binding protein [Clostridiales bacterium]